MIQPFGDQILVKPVQKQQVLVSDDGTLSEYGEVIAVGPDVGRFLFCFKKNNRIKIGDMVGFSVFGIEKLIIDEEKYYFLRESPEFLLCTITA